MTEFKAKNADVKMSGVQISQVIIQEVSVQTEEKMSEMKVVMVNIRGLLKNIKRKYVRTYFIS